MMSVIAVVLEQRLQRAEADHVVHQLARPAARCSRRVELDAPFGGDLARSAVRHRGAAAPAAWRRPRSGSSCARQALRSSRRSPRREDVAARSPRVTGERALASASAGVRRSRSLARRRRSAGCEAPDVADTRRQCPLSCLRPQTPARRFAALARIDRPPLVEQADEGDLARQIDDRRAEAPRCAPPPARPGSPRPTWRGRSGITTSTFICSASSTCRRSGRRARPSRFSTITARWACAGPLGSAQQAHACRAPRRARAPSPGCADAPGRAGRGTAAPARTARRRR